jgi:hypothetical protein
MSSPITFSVQALNVEVTSALAALSGVTDTDFTCDVTADLSISLAAAQDLFRLQSDAIDITDAAEDDIKYAVYYEASNTLDASGIPTEVVSPDWLVNTVCSAGDDLCTASTLSATNKGVAYEYVRYLAHNLFNTHLGVDLFSNEEQLRAVLDISARDELDENMKELHDLGYVLPSTTHRGFSHPSYVMLSKIILDAPDRLASLDEYAIAGGDATGADPANPSAPTFKMPFAVGDKIQFQLKIKAAANQSEIVDSSDAIADRTYKIVMEIEA